MFQTTQYMCNVPLSDSDIRGIKYQGSPFSPDNEPVAEDWELGRLNLAGLNFGSNAVPQISVDREDAVETCLSSSLMLYAGKWRQQRTQFLSSWLLEQVSDNYAGGSTFRPSDVCSNHHVGTVPRGEPPITSEMMFYYPCDQRPSTRSRDYLAKLVIAESALPRAGFGRQFQMMTIKC